MSTLAARPHVHRCALCPRRSATWDASTLPKGWGRIDINREACDACLRKQRRQAGAQRRSA